MQSAPSAFNGLHAHQNTFVMASSVLDDIDTRVKVHKCTGLHLAFKYLGAVSHNTPVQRGSVQSNPRARVERQNVGGIALQ
jgi:hypothetical protein